MADGAGGVGKAVVDAVSDIGKDLTVNMAKDIFDSLSGKKPATNQTTGSNNAAQSNQVQKNIQIATISRRIQMMNQQRQQAAQKAKQNEQQRLQSIAQENQQNEKKKEAGFGGKTKDIFANWGNTLARRGKGEQRGNKASG